ERFLPWVHRIVRNQAFTRMKSSPAARERTFSALQPAGAEKAVHGEWNNLDAILHRLSRSAEERSAREDVPEEQLLRQETLHVLTGIIECLKPRERLVFESHFFDQLSPREIAKLFELSTANVYQIISRSRRKVIQEKIRVTVDSYIKTRKDMGSMKKVILPDSETISEVRTWNTAVDALYTMLKYTDKRLSYPMVAGLTGQAFRINIIPKTVHIAGPTAYNFGDSMTKGLRNAGFHARFVDGLSASIGLNTNLIDPSLLAKEAMGKREIHHALPEALDLIHHSLDRGYPVLAWDIFFPEFGILYGYDDEQRLLLAEECGRRDTLPYENLGRSVLEEIFVLALDTPIETGWRDQVRNALRMIVDHYEGRETNTPSDSVKGLKAYDVWCEAFREGNVEPNGNAYNIAVINDGRRNALEFVKEVLSGWPQQDEADQQIRGLLGETAELYEVISGHYGALHQMFPFPEGGDPNSPENARQSIELLQTIKTYEQAGVSKLLNILDKLG
ncbi:sigma-70 family RNA polymerase sigma factor, partial [Paenibacillus sepulcri]|nr:sigma-70 family RNA polymerase sigma factor [Paenibacillus sepulcri]